VSHEEQTCQCTTEQHHGRATIKQVVVALALEQIGGKRFPPNPFGSLRVWATLQTVSRAFAGGALIWKKATPPPLPLVPRFPLRYFYQVQCASRNKNPNFTPETLHAINYYRAVRVNLITVGNGQVIMANSRWIKDNYWNVFGTLRLPLP